MDIHNYAYAVGRIRVLENKLLNRNELERMLGAANATEAFKILNELDYADYTGDAAQAEQFQAVIDAGLLDTKRLLQKISPDPEVLLLLWLPYDLHNTKVLLRAKGAGLQVEEVRGQFNQLGAVTIEHLIEAAFAGQLVHLGLPEPYEAIIQAAILKARRSLEAVGRAQELDLILDEAYFACARTLVDKQGNQFLTDYLAHLLDTHNLDVVLRGAASGLPASLVTRALTAGGSVPAAAWQRLIGKSVNEVISTLEHTAYGPILAKVRADLQEHGSFLELEKQLHNYLIGLLQKAKLIPFGPEPLIAYFWMKVNNAQLIRLIMVGKLAGLDSEVIRPQLHDLYA